VAAQQHQLLRLLLAHLRLALQQAKCHCHQQLAIHSHHWVVEHLAAALVLAQEVLT